MMRRFQSLVALPLLLPLITTQPIKSPPINTVAPFLVEHRKPVPNFDTEVLAPLRVAQKTAQEAQEAAVAAEAVAQAQAQAEVVYTPPTPVYIAPTTGAKAFIYMHESGNNPGAVNASSGACSLGQALPCSKLIAVCPNWQTDYACDDAFFTNYAISRYGGWEQARQFWLGNSWW